MSQFKVKSLFLQIFKSINLAQFLRPEIFHVSRNRPNQALQNVGPERVKHWSLLLCITFQSVEYSTTVSSPVCILCIIVSSVGGTTIRDTTTMDTIIRDDEECEDSAQSNFDICQEQ